MAREAFSFRQSAELERMTLLELNVYISELRRRAAWVKGAAAASLQAHLDAATAAREKKRKQAQAAFRA